MSMRKSFYQYLLTLRSPHQTPIAQFANHAAKDPQFPKHSEDYQELSAYLEMDVDYLETMTIFDDIWEIYMENNT